MEILHMTVKTPDELKSQLVSRWLNSSLTLDAFAQSRRIAPEVFSSWVTAYRKNTSIKKRNKRVQKLTLVKLDKEIFFSSVENIDGRE